MAEMLLASLVILMVNNLMLIFSSSGFDWIVLIDVEGISPHHISNKTKWLSYSTLRISHSIARKKREKFRG